MEVKADKTTNVVRATLKLHKRSDTCTYIQNSRKTLFSLHKLYNNSLIQDGLLVEEI